MNKLFYLFILFIVFANRINSTICPNNQFALEGQAQITDPVDPSIADIDFCQNACQTKYPGTCYRFERPWVTNTEVGCSCSVPPKEYLESIIQGTTQEQADVQTREAYKEQAETQAKVQAEAVAPVKSQEQIIEEAKTQLATQLSTQTQPIQTASALQQQTINQIVPAEEVGKTYAKGFSFGDEYLQAATLPTSKTTQAQPHAITTITKPAKAKPTCTIQGNDVTKLLPTAAKCNDKNNIKTIKYDTKTKSCLITLKSPTQTISLPTISKAKCSKAKIGKVLIWK